MNFNYELCIIIMSGIRNRSILILNSLICMYYSIPPVHYSTQVL